MGIWLLIIAEWALLIGLIAFGEWQLNRRLKS